MLRGAESSELRGGSADRRVRKEEGMCKQDCCDEELADDDL